MAVSILIITHGNVGKELLSTAKSMLGKLPLTCEALSVSNSCKPDELVCEARRICNKINNGDGVLVLTDMFGSTPSNICNKLKSDCQAETHVIAGLNLPMLIRALNYPELSLKKITDKALSGAHDGIIDCQVND
ncbi:MAG: PTS sugar transporter subunit IIA [Gammaproteobacteria bacterium]